MTNIKFALPNIFDQDAAALADFARLHGFTAIDWSLDPDLSREDFLREMELLDGFEVRYHCRFPKIDLAYSDARSEYAMAVLKRMAEVVSLAGGKHMTIHIGLGLDDDRDLDWRRGVENLSNLVAFGAERGLTISLENLTTVWTSDPDKFRELTLKTGARVTFDIGHAYVCRERNPEDGLYGRYISPHKDRVFNAHIYHTETSTEGHIAPARIEDIRERLDALEAASSCDWWVIELSEPADILKTRELLEGYVGADALSVGDLGDGYIDEALNLFAR